MNEFCISRNCHLFNYVDKRCSREPEDCLFTAAEYNEWMHLKKITENKETEELDLKKYGYDKEKHSRGFII